MAKGQRDFVGKGKLTLNEAIKEKAQVNLIINNHAGGNAPLIGQKIADRLHLEKQQRLF